MEKTRSRSESVLIGIVIVAAIVCVIGMSAILLTSMAPWAFYTTVGSLAVVFIVCVVCTEIYGFRNDSVAGICTCPEPTTKQPDFRSFGSCPKCDFPQPPPDVSPNFCSHCGSPLEKRKPRPPIPQPAYPLRPTYKTEGYDPDDIPNCGTPHENSKPCLPIPQPERPLKLDIKGQ